MSFSVYLLFWMYPITEPKKRKKKWIKKNPYPSFRFNFERTIYLQLVGKSILLFIYLFIKVDSEFEIWNSIRIFFFPSLFFFSSFLYNFLQKDILIKNCIMLSLIQIWIVNKAFPKQIFYLCFYFKKIFLFFKSIFFF